jgi:hypothetical protein
MGRPFLLVIVSFIQHQPCKTIASTTQKPFDKIYNHTILFTYDASALGGIKI